MTKRQPILSIVFACLLLLGVSPALAAEEYGASQSLLPLTAAGTAHTATLQVATPLFTPAAGTFTSHPTVTISCSTIGAIIRYTTYGGEPTSASPQYTGPIPVIITTTLKAKAFKWDMAASNTAIATYTIGNPSTVAAPIFSPSGGTYTSPQNVMISSSTTGATIRYTTNGSEPTSASLQYLIPISISSTSTLKAKAFKSGMTDSITSSATYSIDSKPPLVATPIFTPAAGTFTSHPAVTISCSTIGATIRYTTYGGEPTRASPQYTGPIPVTITTTLKAKAFKSDMSSSTAVATYTIE